MGKAIADAFPSARAVFDRADRALADATPLSQLCFTGPLESLTLTANTQPAILTTSIAILAAVREKLPNAKPAMVAGHSLGEYSALVAAGALAFEDTVKLVRLRGQAMQDAVAPGTGAMAAIMGMDVEAIAAVCEEVRSELPGRVIEPANFNAPGQVVVAGHADAVERFGAVAATKKGRAIPLKVSAPFHCSLMKPAADRLRDALASVTVSAPSCPVVANVDATPNTDATRVKDLLVAQVAGTVRWEQCVKAMVDAGVDTFVEIGSGKVLAGLIKRIHKPAVIHNVSDVASLDAAVAALS
jgi:[acyl-carrier-protein] S-malonyltransferase